MSIDCLLQLSFKLFKRGDLPWHALEALCRELGYKGCDLEQDGTLRVRC